MNEFSERLRTLRKKVGLTQAEMAKKMGLSMSYVHQLENGKRTPSDALETLLKIMESQVEAGLMNKIITETPPAKEELPTNRRIAVLGWAHAGEAGCYDEIPPGWRDWVPTDCRDPKAFAVRLEGDSMEPRFSEGDLLILQPSMEAYNGCLAVVKLANDGIVFRRVEKRAETLQLIPLNTQYAREELPLSQIAWAFPLWGMWRQVWK